MELEHGYRVTVEFNDGTNTMVLEYSKEKVADSVIRKYANQVFVKNISKEEF